MLTTYLASNGYIHLKITTEPVTVIYHLHSFVLNTDNHTTIYMHVNDNFIEITCYICKCFQEKKMKIRN